MKGDYKVPKNLAKNIIAAYGESTVIDPDSDELDYFSTLEAFAERIKEDYDDAKMKRVFGYVMYSTEEIAKWLRDYLPEMFEMLLTINNEL